MCRVFAPSGWESPRAATRAAGIEGAGTGGQEVRGGVGEDRKGGMNHGRPGGRSRTRQEAEVGAASDISTSTMAYAPDRKRE